MMKFFRRDESGWGDRLRYISGRFFHQALSVAMDPCRSQSQKYMQFLLLLAWLLLPVALCDVAGGTNEKEIQYPYDVIIGAQTSKKPIAVLLSLNTGSERSRRFSGQPENYFQVLGDSSDAKHHATPRESNEQEPVSSPVHTCPSPCAAIPPCPELQACPAPCAACPTCPTCKKHIPPGYEYFQDHGYYRLHNVPMTWYEAKMTCEREGAHLAIINSQEEHNLLKTLADRDSDIGSRLHLGFHDLYQEGKYVTIFGQPLSDTGFTDWDVDQPDNFQNNEDCGTMHLSGGLNDLDCSEKEPFVCELPV